jgi:MFS family permease
MTDETDQTTDRGQDAAPDRWWLVAAVGLAVFMASVDMTVVNVALPVIEHDVGTSTGVAEWVMLGYLLPLAGLAVPSGRWLDTVGQRPALVFSLSGFALASVAAGLAPGLGLLVVARVVQGTFGAVLFSLVPALATTAVHPGARSRAMGVITTVGPLGLVTGPVLGGAIVDGPGWRWIFFVNVPISLVVLCAGLRMVGPTTPLRTPDRAWFAEALTLSSAVTVLLASLSFAATNGMGWLIASVLTGPLIIVWLRMPSSTPVRRLLGIAAVVRPHAALTLAATGIGIVFLITPYFLVRTLDTSVSTAGVTVLAFPAGMALTGLVGGFLGDWWGAERTALIGAATFTVGLALLVPMDGRWALGDLAWRLFLAGCGNGLFNAPNMAIAMSHTPRSQLATTGATTSLARQLGFALGPALATLTWASFSFQTVGIQAAMLLATALGAASVATLASGVPEGNRSRRTEASGRMRAELEFDRSPRRRHRPTPE